MFRKLLTIAALLGITSMAWAQENGGQQIFIYAHIPGVSESASSVESLGPFANEAHKDDITVLGYNDGMNQSASYDPTIQQFTFQRFAFHPFSLLKHIDKTTPLLEDKLRNRSALDSIQVSFFQKNPDTGNLELIMTKSFEHCYVTNTQKIILNQGELAHRNLPMMEKIAFVYRRVTTKHEKTGVTYTIDLAQP